MSNHAAKLAELAALRENWDSYGGKPICPNVVNQWRRIIEASDDMEGLWLVPMSGGGIQGEWHRGGCDFEIEINPSGEIAILVSGIGHDLEMHIPPRQTGNG